jgi:serine/threonine protein kinase
MTPDRWLDIFAAVERLDSAPAEDRARLIDELSRDDPELAKQVESVLADDEPTITEERIHDVIAGQAAALAEYTPPLQERYGRYKIVRAIGRGGMGLVYEAVRVDDFHKKVALKIIQQGLDTAFARERFQQERQLLASLEHPYIARLIDGGESDDGRPYLVLEYVDGEPFQQCASRLDRNGRLGLFLKVCEAVDYAHRNLVIHRDLKPGNVLVTRNGEPKLLDFGIAKLLSPDAAKTLTGYTSLTPDYASPEQVRGQPITTASDVYSLGVMLYQLLTGRKPYTIDASAPVEMDRIICRELPPPPGLGNELDYIILMAMRKEPERRYGTVLQFAEDIRRYLDQRPVIARPDTLRYRTAKFVRRNKMAFTAALVAVLALAGGLGAALYEARLANRRFNDVRSLATSFLFDFDKELAAVPGNTKARNLLVTTAQKNLDNLAATAGNDEGLLSELAAAYEKLGDIQGMPGISNLGLQREAATSYRKAIAILERLAKRYPRYRSRLITDLGRTGRIVAELNETDLAMELGARSASLSDELHAESPGDVELTRNAARAFDLLSALQRGHYHAEEALESSRKSVALYESAIPPGAPPKASHQLAIAFNRLAMAQRDLGDLDAAIAADKRTMEMENRILSAIPGDIPAMRVVAGVYQDLAVVEDSYRYPSRDNPNAAIGYLGESLRIFSRLAEADRHDIGAQTVAALIEANLALESLHRDPALADRLSEKAADSVQEVLRRAPGAGFPLGRWPAIGWMRAKVLAQLGRKREAIDLSRQALDAERKLNSGTADDRLDLAGQWLLHAQVLVQCDEPDAAAQAGEEAAKLVAGIDTEIHRWMSFAYQAGSYYFRLAQVLESTKLRQQAAANYGEAARLWTPWQSGHAYMQARVAAATAARDRCRG